MSLLPVPTEWRPREERFHTWEIIVHNPPVEGEFDPTKPRPAAPVIQEDEVPRHSPKGGRFTDFMGPSPGIAFYADGYTYDGYGWRQEIPLTRVLSLWSNISITETHEGIRTQIEVNAEEPAIPHIQELVTDFVFYRDGEKLYRLRCVDSEDVLTRDAATVRFDCVSYDKLFERRILHEDWILDDGDINCAWRLIDYTQRRETFGVSRGTKTAGNRRERALDAGDDILTAINDFAQSDGGFDWWIDADLKFWAAKPRRGKGHRMMWMLGGEVAEMTRINPIEDYASLIMATGANSEIRIPRETDATIATDTSKPRKDAPRVNLNDLPEHSPTGAALKGGGAGFISTGRGLGVYRDGFVYDGKGWRNPSGMPTDYLGRILKAGQHRVKDIQDGAPRLAEDDIPTKSPTGAEVKEGAEGYRSFPNGRGLATYTDGFVFDGLGWRNSGGKITYDDGEVVTETKIVEDVYPPPNPQVVQLGNKPLGLWEMTTSDTDVITAGALVEKARWHLGDKGKIRPTYKLMLEPGVWTPNYALGDTFTLRIDTVRANVKVLVRIEELSVTCSSDGAETVALAVRAEAPEIPVSDTGGLNPLPQLMTAGVEAFADDFDDAPAPNGRTVARHRLTETDDLGAILRAFRKRLDRIERSRGIGGGGGVNILDGEGPPTCEIGSPGDYYVDTLDWRLFGPKYFGGTMLSPGATWKFKEIVSTPNDRVLNAEVGWVGYVFEDVDIVGFRFDGLTCGVTDSFDRANGPLGSDWVSEPNIPAYFTANHDLKITTVSGGTSDPGSTDKGAVGTVEDTVAPSSIGNTMRWAHAQPSGTQSIEVSLDLYQFWNSAGGYFYLFTKGNGTNAACILMEFSHANYDMPTQPQQPLVRFTAFEADGTPHSNGEETIPLYFGSSTPRIRLESDPDGENRLYCDPNQPTPNGEILLLKTWQSPIPVTGSYVGFGTSWGEASNGYRYSPKFKAVTIGCPGAGVIGADRPTAPVSGTLTVSVWDWDKGELLYRTVAPAAGTDWVEIPPIRFTVKSTVEEAATGASSRWCVSLGGDAVPIHTPGHQFKHDEWPPSIGSYGPYYGPVGSSPETLSGYFGPMPCLYVRFQSLKCYAATPEDCDSLSEGVKAVEPDTLVSGEVGKMLSVYNSGWLLGWRYKRMAGQSSPVTFTVWDWKYRYYSEGSSGVKPFSDGRLAQVTVADEGEGEFEVRLTNPIVMDYFGRLGPSQVMITVGGTAIGIDTSTTGLETGGNSTAGWYGYHFGFSYLNPVIGEMPHDNIGSYPNYHAWPMVPIMQRSDIPAWPTTDLARSGSTGDHETERVELHRNINYPTSDTDYSGLRFYEWGPSHDATSWGKGEGLPAFSTSMIYDGYSGIGIFTDDWYDEDYGVVYPEPNRYTNRWAYYTWYYDYQYWEQWASLDANNEYWPGADFGTWGESGAWDDDSYWAISTEGPHHAAGFHCESAGVGPMVKNPAPPCDDFERADGALGPNWSIPSGSPVAYSINSGALVVTPASDAAQNTRVWWTANVSGDQFVEVDISDWASPPPSLKDAYVEIYTQMSASGASANVVMLNPTCKSGAPNDGTNGRLDWTFASWTSYGDWSGASPDNYRDGVLTGINFNANPHFIVRMESYTSDRQVLIINGITVADWISPVSVVGPYVGLNLVHGQAAGGGVSPRVHSFCTVGQENETTGIATMFSSGFDGIAGTQLSVTPRVIQACFQPEGTYNTWWYGDGSAPYGLTPRGCVVPLITAGSATATAADEPWQKQFFRQIGNQSVAFEDGRGQVRVPTAMGTPCVASAQVEGVTASGHFVVQTSRVSQYLISVALNTTFTGSLDINWSVDAAAVTFGTPPPSIDTIRNPGTMYSYGPYVEYEATGGTWPFELISWADTFQAGCVLKDFTGATVGGPFTPEDLGGGVTGSRVLWDAGRNWYLPDQTQQYRMTNPDGQTSSWNVITWVEHDVFARTLADSALRIVARTTEEQPEEGVPARPAARYANNPRLQPPPEPPPTDPVITPLMADGGEPDPPISRGPDSPRERRERLSADERKEQRLARQERQRQERAAKAGRPPTEEPPVETTEQ